MDSFYNSHKPDYASIGLKSSIKDDKMSAGGGSKRNFLLVAPHSSSKGAKKDLIKIFKR